MLTVRWSTGWFWVVFVLDWLVGWLDVCLLIGRMVVGSVIVCDGFLVVG